jgi:PKD repeat protein
LQRITSPWDEQTTTWNTQPAYSETDQVLLPSSNSSYQDYLNIDVTNLVIEMHNQPDQNYGFMFNMITTEPYASMIFASSDHPNLRLRPRLEITYLCQYPLADFTFTSNSGVYDFFNQSLDATSMYWDFGDGYFSTLWNPQHTYSANGNYLVAMTALNDCGSVSSSKLLQVCDSLRSDFLVSNADGLLIEFQNNTVGANGYLWDFGDGSFSVNYEATHYFIQDGEYNVCLIVNNECTWDTSCRVVNIETNGIGKEPESSLLIKPNPSSEGFAIESEMLLSPCSLRICNTNGQIVYSKEINSKWNRIQIPKLVAGIYFLVLNTDTFAISKKLVSIP